MSCYWIISTELILLRTSHLNSMILCYILTIQKCRIFAISLRKLDIISSMTKVVYIAGQCIIVCYIISCRETITCRYSPSQNITISKRKPFTNKISWFASSALSNWNYFLPTDLTEYIVVLIMSILCITWKISKIWLSFFFERIHLSMEN